jgi:hypothetical protein
MVTYPTIPKLLTGALATPCPVPRTIRISRRAGSRVFSGYGL